MTGFTYTLTRQARTERRNFHAVRSHGGADECLLADWRRTLGAINSLPQTRRSVV